MMSPPGVAQQTATATARYACMYVQSTEIETKIVDGRKQGTEYAVLIYSIIYHIYEAIST